MTVQRKVKVLPSLVYKKKEKIGRSTRKGMHLKYSEGASGIMRVFKVIKRTGNLNSCRHIPSLLRSFTAWCHVSSGVHFYEHLSWVTALTNALYILRALILFIIQDNYLDVICIFNLFIMLLNTSVPGNWPISFSVLF